VADILAAGNAHANELADATIRDVRELMGMVYG
jgi:tryptophanyl-tRNA synthetase